MKGMTFLHDDALVIFTILYNHRVYRELVNEGRAVNILFNKIMAQIEINPLRLTLMKTPLIGIIGLRILMKDALETLITISTYPKCLTLQQTFMIIDMSLVYNAIIECPFSIESTRPLA
jgi:hypothetical protein